MKAKEIITGLMFVFPLFLSGCGANGVDDEAGEYRDTKVLYAKGSKLVRVYQVFDDYKQLFTEYRYDNKGRISKVIHPTAADDYDIYQYDGQGRLAGILKYSYSGSPDRPSIFATITYSYDGNGNKIKELVEESYENRTRYTLYEYENNRLVKTAFYNGGQFSYYVLCEYEGDKLVKEKLFVSNDDSFVTTGHTYIEGLLTYSITYYEDPKSGFMYDSRKFYDLNGNLVRTIDNHPGLSSSSFAKNFYETRTYEYED